MPTNILKVYNDLLDTLYATQVENLRSFRKVFNRDFIENGEINFKTNKIYPLPSDRAEDLDRLFKHLTEVEVDSKTKERNYEHSRSIRIHWIRYHLEDGKKTKKISYSFVQDENTLYIIDEDEHYGIFLEPMKKTSGFYLKSAYLLEASRYKKVMTKIHKRGTPL